MFILILLCLIFTAAKKASIEQSSQEGQQFQEGCQDILDWVSDLREKLQEQPPVSGYHHTCNKSNMTSWNYSPFQST
jgi:hypothetical protein